MTPENKGLDVAKKQKEIAASFDFKRVHAAMKALDWKWCHSSGYGVPGVEVIRETALRLLSSAIKEYNNSGDPIRVSSGGFSASVQENGQVALEFILTSVEA